MAWFLGITKVRTEIREIKKRIAKMDHDEQVRKAGLTLWRRAAILLREPNRPAALSKAEWASFLPDPVLIDEALREVTAYQLPSDGRAAEIWEIDIGQPNLIYRALQPRR